MQTYRLHTALDIATRNEEPSANEKESAMTDELDLNEQIEILCPKCGHQFNQSVRDFEKHPDLNCPTCWNAFRAQTDGSKRILDEREKAVRDILRHFRK
jgi:DNA-directed RNA polymerase subunit RPC12/RpoP